MNVEIYTDGSAIRNPGPGGYAAIMRCNGVEKRISKGFRMTTNNRMELMAVVVAIEALKKPVHVVIYSDSRYVVNPIASGSMNRWFKRNFKGKANADLWRRLCKAQKGHRVMARWVKGHSGNPGNEACDRLAYMAAILPEDYQGVDHGYENYN